MLLSPKTKKSGGFVETVKTLVFALLIAGAFRTLFFQPFWIPSGSMKETLLIGDFLFVNKMAYGYSRYSCPFSACPVEGRLFFSPPERGDVVVFRHPVNGQDFIKRLIGLPGDSVQLKGGVVYLNGEALPQEKLPPFTEIYEEQGSMRNMPRCANEPLIKGEVCVKERDVETLPSGKKYTVLNVDKDGYSDNTAVFTVPDGHYFFIGDNRDNSLDSRYSQAVGSIGFVPEENLIGRADRIMFSSAGKSLLFFWTWRPDRFFKAVE